MKRDETIKNFELGRAWKGFWQLADPKIWIASTIPMVVGAALAFGDTGKFNLYWFIISLIGIYFIEIAKNAVNEVVDYRSGVDRFIAPDKKTPFSGGKKTIVEGKLTVLEAALIALLTLGAGCLIGMYITFFREPYVFIIGFIGVILSVFYSLPPLKLAYRGLGEVVVGITFGPLVLAGMYLVMANSLNIYVIIASLPICFLIMNVLWINQFPDYEADKQGGKKNWVVRIGKKKAVNIYAIIYVAAYIPFIILSIIYWNPFWLLGLASVPIAMQSISVAKKYYDDIPKLMQANAKTVITYQVTGLAMIVAAVMNKFF